MDRYAYLRASLGNELLENVQKAKLLVVGAGGIGCELLKNLALSGFISIEVIDLDTIDVSNLNRQFLFRREHVGMSKAKVAAEVVKIFNPDINIVAHHGNVKSTEFGLNFIGKFDIVLNALDNIDARRHVNRLCIARNKPLIESGTSGYLGQVSVIRTGETECYECQPKPTQKTYPICTIRSTPDKPVHCIVWAKELFKLVFGDSKESMLYENLEGDEPSVYMEIVESRHLMLDNDAVTKFASDMLISQFEAEIKKRISMDIYKGAKMMPMALCAHKLAILASEYNQAPTRLKKGKWGRDIWTFEESAREFSACIHDIFDSIERKSLVGSMSFEKDDKIAMRFVTAACNLRSLVFHIPLQSYHDAQGIAGNIIPAIATTNAIIAGLQVIEALKIIQNSSPILDVCRYVYCLRETTRKGLLLQPVKLAKPNPKCFICNSNQIEISIDTENFTLSEFVSRVLKARLGVNEPSITIGGSIVYEEGEECSENLIKNLPLILKNLPGGGIVDGTILNIDDFTQNIEITVCISHRVFDPEEIPEGFILLGDADLPKYKDMRTSPSKVNPECALMPPMDGMSISTKRLRETNEECIQPKCKAKIIECTEDNDVVCLDE